MRKKILSMLLTMVMITGQLDLSIQSTMNFGAQSLFRIKLTSGALTAMKLTF